MQLNNLTTPPTLTHWQLGEHIADGISSSVFSATHKKTGQHAAIKIMQPISEDNLQSFNNEITWQNLLKNETSVLHMLDANIDASLKTASWIAFPLGTPALLYVNQTASPKILLQAISSTMQTLKRLLKKDIYYLDLKLDNIIYINETFLLADIGTFRYTYEDPNGSQRSPAQIEERYHRQIKRMLDQFNNPDDLDVIYDIRALNTSDEMISAINNELNALS